LPHSRDNAVYCPLCPGWRDISDIIAKSDDPKLEDRSWSEVLPRGNGRSRRPFGVGRGTSIQESAILVAQGWKPHCPTCGEALPDTLNRVQVIAVMGNYNSSKSHYIAGLVHELTSGQSLRPLGIDVSFIADTAVIMDEKIHLVYAKRQVLPHTERGSVYGPYMYRLTRRSGGIEESTILIFFDLAGEDAASLRDVAKVARYIFDATGIILLLDPDGLPREGTTLEAIDPNTRLISRLQVDTPAELIQRVKGISPRQRDQQLVVTMAKADKLRLPESLYPPPSLVGSSARSVRKQLTAYSKECAAQMTLIGAGSVVEAAYSRFGAANVHFAMISATGEDPQNGSWVSPAPRGCSLPIAQILLASHSLGF
jgi:hypothetical protein